MRRSMLVTVTVALMTSNLTFGGWIDGNMVYERLKDDDRHPFAMGAIAGAL